jgi:hypothetical protein
VKAFVDTQRDALSSDVLRRARRVAAVLIEPIQGEGGVRMASARFMRMLRLLTCIYDVPLIFDEVQTGWGMTGRLWAHEWFELPCPPDLVTWAKKAQNGVLFVSDPFATFFQEEKKFNTTWEGDSVGMVRLIALLDRLDLEQVQRTGDRTRSGLESLAREYPEIIKNVRGKGVMLAFDVQRADLRDSLLDRAFRRGLVLLAAGERAVRVYPRYDTEPSATDEALAILRVQPRHVHEGHLVLDHAGEDATQRGQRKHRDVLAGQLAAHLDGDRGRLGDTETCRTPVAAVVIRHFSHRLTVTGSLGDEPTPMWLRIGFGGDVAETSRSPAVTLNVFSDRPEFRGVVQRTRMITRRATAASRDCVRPQIRAT